MESRDNSHNLPIKDKLLQLWWKMDRTIFPITQRMGFHITKTHFYSPIPDTRDLPDSLWEKQNDLTGINISDESQLALLTKFATRYRPEYQQIPTSPSEQNDFHGYYLNNGMFDSVDGEILYCMVRDFRPQSVLELGSGNSTRLISAALERNKQEDQPQHQVFDPYADLKLGELNDITKVYRTRAQDVPVNYFQQLRQNDMLFIDSSHILKIGSDVHYLYTEVLPKISNGVVVHIHDVYLPQEYPKDFVKRRHCFNSEQYILQAFLTFNDRFRVLWGSNYMRLYHPEALSQAFPSFDPQKSEPESFWIQRVKD